VIGWKEKESRNELIDDAKGGMNPLSFARKKSGRHCYTRGHRRLVERGIREGAQLLEAEKEIPG